MQDHIIFDTQAKLLQLDWEVLIHYSYSPDLAPSDFHLLQSLQHFLNGKNFNPWKTVNNIWNSSLLKKMKYWKDGIMKLPEKWQMVVEQNGEYLVQ